MSSSHTPVKATKRLFYPFLHTDGKQVKHVSAYYKALAQAGEGYYPMGHNGQWHGGIHFNKATASAGDLKQATGVRCLADGEVVAWRIDKTYPQVAYPALTENGVTVHDACKATYSTGFVLVRHRLALPQPPQSGDSQAQGASSSTVASGPAASPPSVEFYSLYMHLMSWDNYQRHPADEFRPHLWPANGPMYRADKASDHYTKEHNPYAPTDDSKGVNLRKKGEHATYMGFAPKNAVLKLGDKETSQYYEVLAIDGENVGLKEGLDASALQNVVAWKGELTAMPSQPSQFGHVVVPDTPIAIKAGDIVGHLGIYEHFADVKHTPAAHATPPTVFAPDSDHEMMHLEVFTTDPNFIKTCRQQARYALDSEKSLLFIKKGAQLALPTQADTSIAASTLVQAVGGDDKSPWVKVVYATGSQETIIAHADLGAYHDGSYALEAKTRKALHTAIPTVAEGDFLGRVKFISKSNKTNRLVKAHYGKQAWIKRSDLPDPHDATATDAAIEAWSKFPLQTDATNGPKATLEKVMPIHDLTDRATALTHTDDGNHDNDKTARWWHVEVATTDDQAKGWACEAGQSDVSLCSPWDWPGFEEETAAATPEQLYAAATLAHRNYAADEKAKLEALAQQASTGPLFKQMCQIIDSKGQGSGKSNGTLSSEEITTAMHDPMIVRHMAHLIVKHKSEWAEPDATKSAIKPLIPQRSHKDWDAEAKRVAKLAWWEDAANKGILKNGQKIATINPVAIISAFGGPQWITLHDAQYIAIMITAGFENNRPSYGGLAGNFDGQGMSYGLMQWNFGTGTLGPLLLAMHKENKTKFKASFESGTDYESILTAIQSGDSGQPQQMSWAISQESTNNSNWKKTFSNLASITEFQQIQFQFAVREHKRVEECISFLRALCPDLMQLVHLFSYCALFDLCNQEGSLHSARSEISSHVSQNPPKSQKELLVIASTERAKKARHQYASDALSRRLGIINGKPTSATLYGVTKKRTNSCFDLLKEKINACISKD